nr:MAG TPA: hypothetical protein [Caudoviricetes sp.]
MHVFHNRIFLIKQFTNLLQNLFTPNYFTTILLLSYIVRSKKVF